MPARRSALIAAAVLGIAATRVRAQDNYEIQVYGSQTVDAGRTMVELHSNFTPTGSLTTADGTYPTNHAFHETLEITHGLNDWSELGFYLFNSVRSGQGWQFVGSHIRPRVRAPESWGWPFGASLSAEVGYQREQFSPDTWSLELRPIIDKQIGRWYGSFNPTLERALKGPGTSEGLGFSPNATVGADVSKKVNLALEYYGAMGSITGFAPLAEQEHVLFAATNLDLGPDWEFNFGYGQALTGAGDRRVVKMILGRRVGHAAEKAPQAPHSPN